MKKEKFRQKNIVITASTFPRWDGDTVPAFVKVFAERVSADFKNVKVIVPHYANAKKYEKLRDNLEVIRFQYFLPSSQENIVYDTHSANRVSANPAYLTKLICLIMVSFIVTLRRSLVKNNVINAHWLIPQGVVGVVVGKISNSKVVVTIHGSDVFTLNNSLLKKIKRWALKNADVVVVNSSATKLACRQIYSNREYRIIPMGVDIDEFIPVRHLNKAKNLKVLFVGRLSKEKGIMYLLNVAKMCSDNNVQNIHFIIVGDGPQKGELVDFVSSNNLRGMVSFEGWKDHGSLTSYYQNADIFVGPSVEENGIQEALGLTFIEAASSGLPVISTKIGGISDVVYDGETGYLVDQKSSQQIYDKVMKLMNNKRLRKEMGNKGRRHIEEKFSWDKITNEYRTIFDTP